MIRRGEDTSDRCLEPVQNDYQALTRLPYVHSAVIARWRGWCARILLEIVQISASLQSRVPANRVYHRALKPAVPFNIHSASQKSLPNRTHAPRFGMTFLGKRIYRALPEMDPEKDAGGGPVI